MKSPSDPAFRLPEARREGPGATQGPPLTLDDAASSEARPLRLRISRGGLGVELGRPIACGPLVIEHLEWSLPELVYPLDLSAGVKHFLQRPGLLERLVLRVKLGALAELIGSLSGELFGGRVQCRLRAESAGDSTLHAFLGRGRSGVAFDLVLSSSMSPRLVVDGARALGLGLPAFQAVLQAISPAMALQSGLAVEGRSISLEAVLHPILVEAVAALGARLPEVGRPRLAAFRADRGDLVLDFDSSGEAMSVGRRGLRLAGLADVAAAGDRALAGGDSALARAQYLEALENNPHSVELLTALAELDLLATGRHESAGFFLEEAQTRARDQDEKRSSPAGAQLALLEAALLEKKGRTELAGERFERAAGLEPEAHLSALLSLLAAHLASDRAVARQRLDQAISRAPTLPDARWASLEHRLAGSPVEEQSPAHQALQLDLQQILAATRGVSERAEALRRAGFLLAAAGYDRMALGVLREADGLEPDRAEVLDCLGELLLRMEQAERGIDCLRTALSLYQNPRSGGNTPDVGSAIDRITIRLAEALVSHWRDYAEAIGLVRAVDSRSSCALRARELECAIALELGDERVLERSLTRLSEALELGWIPLGEEARAQLAKLLDRIEIGRSGRPVLHQLRELLSTPSTPAPSLG